MFITMEDIKPNSHKYREEAKKVEKVVSRSAKVKKKSELNKFRDVFIAEDASTVKSYVFMDVLVPAVKKLISDIITDGIDILLYGGTSNHKKKSGSSKVSYRDYYARKDDRHSEPRTRSRFDYDDIVFDTRGDAEAVLDQMQDVIDKYEFVSVADMYEMSDLPASAAPYTANDYGWTNLRTAEIIRVRDGYVIKMPKARPLD